MAKSAKSDEVELAQVETSADENRNCYGLALAGYGSRAAWQAGAIKGLVDKL